MSRPSKSAIAGVLALLATLSTAHANSDPAPIAAQQPLRFAQQVKPKPNPPAAAKKQPAQPPPANPGSSSEPGTQPLQAQPLEQPSTPSERIEVDVSTRIIDVTSAFSGTEIILFGTVVNSQQVSAESGYYDVVAVLEGRGATSIVRLKSNVGGLWINSQSVRFDNLPLYSAIASSRPLDEIAEPAVFVANVIGYTRARMFPGRHSSDVDAKQLDDYKTAALRLKQKDGLYVNADYGVAFIGPALFRATIRLPANIPVGPLDARIFLFHDGQLLASQKVSVVLERQGLDRLIYDFAFEHPVWNGILTVAMAAFAGLAASVIFRRPTS